MSIPPYMLPPNDQWTATLFAQQQYAAAQQQAMQAQMASQMQGMPAGIPGQMGHLPGIAPPDIITEDKLQEKCKNH